MKQLKKWISALLCMALALCLALPAWAEAPEETPKYTLTIKSETPGHTYQAYQVFSGTLAKDPANQNTNTLVDLAWGSGVTNTDALVAAIKAITVTKESVETKPFEGCNDANAIAAVLTKENNNSELLDAFADVVADYYVDDGQQVVWRYLGTAAGTGETVKDSVEPSQPQTYTATISDLPAGYYLVKEGTIKEGSEAGNAYTKYMLNLVKDVEVDAKADAPTLDKQVKDKGESSASPADATNVSVGDTVTYTLTSKVPAMDGYEKYYFIVNDTLSKGLTLDKNSIAITIGSTRLNPVSNYATVTVDPATPTDGVTTSLKIVFKDFIQWKPNAGQDIVITYDATLDKDAVIGNTGNTNDATLTYSNDPNYDYTGEDEPDPEKDPDEPVGETPSSTTDVYTTRIQLNKVDENIRPLTGAVFTIKGTGVVTPGVTTTTEFVVDEVDGTYYKLKNGAYTKVEPTPDTVKFYDEASPYQKYSQKTTTTTWESEEAGDDETVVGTVGADGVVTFEGLGAGTYTIEETTAPTNYNKIDPMTLIISCEVPDEIVSSEEPCIWKYTVGNGPEQTASNGTISLNVENRSGTQLPSTGGIGTTIFLWGGAGLMLAVLLLLGLRIRSKKEENDQI